MSVKKLPIVKSDERGTIYDCDKINYLIRKKGTISSDHTHPEAENIYLIEGEIENTIGDKTEKLKAPVKIEVPPNVYHKIVALTDIKILYYYK